MSRSFAVVFCALVMVAGCSHNPERSAASPTAPSGAAPTSLLGPTSVAPGGVSGKFDVSFPPRNDSFDFRTQLETKYLTSLGRAASPSTFVDREGEVVWTQEYMRYRTNGCDHATATARVLSQIDGQAAGQVCGAPPDGLIAFPPRTDSFDFRRQLESRYQQFGRGLSSTSVDAEGGVIWTQEYLRYRVNACDHTTAVQKVFSQIDGGGVAPTCFVPPCIFALSPNAQSAAAAGGTFTTTVTRTSGENCSFGSESLDSWISIGSGGTGTGASTVLTYTVAPNFGSARSGLIRVRWTNNSALLEINQAAGTSAVFTMTDPNTSSSATTTCQIKLPSTSCVFTASGGFTSNAIYTWHVEYQYGGGISHDFSSTSPTFAFTQMCSGPGATAAGVETPLNVWLTVTDGASSVGIRSGEGAQPPLLIKFFTC
jgi:hypothetical protein